MIPAQDIPKGKWPQGTWPLKSPDGRTWAQVKADRERKEVQ